MATLPSRTKDNPWKLKTPPGLQSSRCIPTRRTDGRSSCVRWAVPSCTTTPMRRRPSRMLKKSGEWVDLGGADEQKPAKEGSVEAWGRSPSNPIGGWYG